MGGYDGPFDGTLELQGRLGDERVVGIAERLILVPVAVPDGVRRAHERADPAEVGHRQTQIEARVADGLVPFVPVRCARLPRPEAKPVPHRRLPRHVCREVHPVTREHFPHEVLVLFQFRVPVRRVSDRRRRRAEGIFPRDGTGGGEQAPVGEGDALELPRLATLVGVRHEGPAPVRRTYLVRSRAGGDSQYVVRVRRSRNGRDECGTGERHERAVQER
mmetsp:Transcript_42205/g.82817  ORF Transcript_42205/g.82817 Transcript_42205/m.82817 type:complete len:219 (+) Transcript_42205:760-1416(+)